MDSPVFVSLPTRFGENAFINADSVQDIENLIENISDGTATTYIRFRSGHEVITGCTIEELKQILNLSSANFVSAIQNPEVRE